MATPAQIAANRRNASKSTGPRTSRGKVWSRRNGWKHGCFATPDTLHPDHLAQLEIIHSKYAAEYQPKTPEFQQVVEQLAVAEWRSNRAESAEAQLIQSLMPKDGPANDATRIAYERALYEGSLLTIHRFHDRAQRQFIRALRIVDIAERSQFPQCSQQTSASSKPENAEALALNAENRDAEMLKAA